MRTRFPKPLAIIAIILLLAMGITGCATIEQQPGPAAETPVGGPVGAKQGEQPPIPTETPVTPISPEKAQNLWQSIQEKGKMVVGVSSGYPPFVYHTPEGQLNGFDIALMKEIGKSLGVEVVFQDAPFDQLLNKVQAGEVDAAIGAIAITPARQEKVAFTAPYLQGDVALLANADANLPPLQQVEDLAKLKVGAETGTDFADWLRTQVENGALPQENIYLYPTIGQTVEALVDDVVDVVLVDAFTAEDLARQTRGKLQLLNRRGKVLLTYKPLTDMPLQGVEWVLTTYADDEGNQLPTLSSAPITATIANAVISGNAGCNSYSADLQINASDITVTTPVTTRKSCEEPAGVMDQEDQFLKDLINAATYHIEGDTLMFRDKEGTLLLVFKARPEIDLTNVTWNLYAYGALSQPRTVPESVDVTLDINEDSEVSGSSGCNDYAGKATIDGASVTFELGAATMKACDPTTNAVETTYLSALAGVGRGEINQDQLILYYNGGLDALKFRAQRKNPLQFTNWQLMTFGPPDKGKAPLATTQLIALFGQKKMTGSAGCNRFNTTYQVKGNKIKIGNIALTRKLCPDDKVNKQEGAYVKNLRAARKYRFIGVSVATSGLYQQAYAIAAPPGAEELLNNLNNALAQLEQDKTIEALSQRYLPIPPVAGAPIETPAPGCTDKLKWVADITYDDHNMRKPPIVDPGAPFQKVWRVKNAGDCTWTTDYYLDFAHGNRPGADMSGGRSYIDKEVKPGETYDLKLDLIAPVEPGVYQGFWNLHNDRNQPFAQLWVGIKVPAPETPIPTPTPTPTATPSPIVQFTADHTHIQAGSCTTLYWDTQNVTQAYLFEEGEDWQSKEVPQQGSQQVCPDQTTTYNLGVVLEDGSRSISSLTIQVSAITPPQIVSFTSTPQNSVTLGQPVTLYWDVRGDVLRISVWANDAPLLSNAPAYGSLIDYPRHTGQVQYTIQAQGPGGTSVNEIVIQVEAEQPTLAPTKTLVPPTETPVPSTETPAPPTETPPVQDIINTTWHLMSMTQAKSEPRPVLPGTKITLFLDPGGAFNGFAGCNNYAGTYALGVNNAIAIKLGQVTKQSCPSPKGVMEQEQQYLQALQGAQSYAIGNDSSFNIYAEGQWILSFMAATPR